MAAGREPWFTSSIARAWPFIRRGVREGLSAGEMQRLFSRQGIGVRRTELLKAIRHEKGVEISRNYMQSIRKDRRFDPTRLKTAATKIRREYSFSVEVRGFHFETGESMTRHVQVSFDSILTPGEIESEAAQIVAERFKDTKMVVQATKIVDPMRAGAPGLV